MQVLPEVLPEFSPCPSDEESTSASVSCAARPVSSDIPVSLQDSSGSSSGSLQLILAELRESNQHMKTLTSRINDIDKRVQSLEDDADDENNINEGSKQMKSKKRKRKMDGPSKDVRVSFVYTLKCMVVREYVLYQ